MTAQEKAKQLVEKFKGIVYPYLGSGMLVNQEEPNVILNNAKICANIVVDEILSFQINSLKWDEKTNGNIIYWQEVKEEIEKL